ncbi:caspase family protein [candidate division KSB1 bacterium]|nr:caspase family protein [candidate division KSB1 bacterium]
MKKYLILCCAVLLCEMSGAQTRRSVTVQPRAATEEARYALVIGNSAYSEAPLRNPVNDTRAMAELLRSQSFTVFAGENLNNRQMTEKILDFGERLRSDAVALFYYSGHGVQMDGVNYLIPINADIRKEQDVRFECVPADRVLAEMEAAKTKLNIVILDACRNNPFERSFRSATRGLAMMNAPKGTFIAYATKPGSVAADGDGSYGLYTSELIKYMREPGLKIQDVFIKVCKAVSEKSKDRQLPWTHMALTGDFYFIPPSLQSQQQPGLPPQTPGSGGVDLSAYRSEAEKLAAKQQWQTWQEKMNSSYREAQNLDADANLTPQKKAQMWRDFSNGYKEDNPYSQDDETLRARAAERLLHWNHYAPPKPITPAVDESPQTDRFDIGTVRDIDGNVYKTVKIGNQWWMAENLKVTRYRNGDAIPHVTDNNAWEKLTTGAYCNYDNNETHVATYGRLYNWYAVNDPRGLAPAGWHVPSYAEWKKLEMFLGMSQSEADEEGWRGAIGGKLREAGTAHWERTKYDATNATNASGFSGLPGGCRYANWDAMFEGLGDSGNFWLSTEYTSLAAWRLSLTNTMLGVYHSHSYKLYGFSVRCLLD